MEAATRTPAVHATPRPPDAATDNRRAHRPQRVDTPAEPHPGVLANARLSPCESACLHFRRLGKSDELPIKMKTPPLRGFLQSGRRASNPRPSAWEGFEPLRPSSGVSAKTALESGFRRFG